jgi:uncharacterized phiE125 gp8 family phage protein
MTLTLVQGPMEPVVTLAETKAHLRVDTSASDDQITALIASATAYVDGLGGILGRALRPQTWRLELPAFPIGSCGIQIPLPPTIAINSVSYLDGSGTEIFLTDSEFRVIPGGSRGDTIRPALGTLNWPIAYAGEPDAVRVVFDAGYVSISSPESEAIPASIREAILLLIKSWYDRQGTEDVPEVVFTLLAPYRLAMIS